ncbi:Bcr/CflA family multidrug efflux MFS transporter [Nisaea acidiphila]|uniref:Bcr/CflA family efflux transporter n=1 Tax=Nisaea acidiphila TaxID=1862145 RepID=A0A9J7AQK3_9PROT|nr:Bcr/CflA family multidrug efflux MFS transporter [Nisaea acidiphila]UUX49883.1 Bcr/CflA family multidrug efflux MFS transporter [Nisaea acidiphila]
MLKTALIRLPTGALVVLLAALAAFAPMSIDMYLPALPEIARDLDVPAREVQATLAVFLAGFSGGMLIYGPISDRFGRRPVLLAGIAVFIVASLVCMVVERIDGLIVARLFQAIGGGAASILARTVVRDLFPPSEAASKLSLMMVLTTLAPILAPLAGAALLEFADWRAIFATLFGFGAIAFVLVLLMLPETYAHEDRGGMSLLQALGAYRHILMDPPAFGLTVASAAVFGGLFAYISGSSFVFIEYFGLTPGYYAVLFAMNSAAIMLAAFVNSRLTKHVDLRTLLRAGVVIAALAGIYLLALERSGMAGPYSVLVGLMAFVAMVPILGANGMAVLMARYPKNAGAAAATVGAAQFGGGAVSAMAVGALHDGTAYSMCAVMFGFGIVSVLFLFGPGRRL